MRKLHTFLATTLAVGLLGTGYLAAQPGDKPAPGDAPLPDVTVQGETSAKLSPREMTEEADRLTDEMDTYHLRVLELQKSARKAKDVIKLNCVNEKLLAVKQLMNIADSAERDLTEAIAGDDRDAEVAKYGQVVLAHERATSERDEAEGCIGEELIFVGPTKIEVSGPTIPDDPTDDPEDPYSSFTVDFERANQATPFF
jgi:hypothetical protein